MIDYSLHPLSVDLLSDLERLEQAYDWIRARPWAYPFSGGGQTLEEYILDAVDFRRKDIGIFDDHNFISLITVIKEGDEYRLHVTSPRGAMADVVTDAARSVIHHLFETFGAASVYTSSPVYGGRHRHAGSIRLCEACGAERTGDIEGDEFGNFWIRYEITRERWAHTYGRQE